MLDVPSDRAAQLIEYTASTRGQWLSGYPALLAQSRCLLAVAGQRRAARTESSGNRLTVTGGTRYLPSGNSSSVNEGV